MVEPRAATSPLWVAHSKWSAERPRTLVVCCSDGRWHSAIGEYIDHEIDDRSDLYAVPGGPACLDPWASSFDEARAVDSALRLFEEHHDLRAIWLISHDGCAHYRVRHPGESATSLLARQIADLHSAHTHLEQRYPRLEVRLVHAALEGQRVTFRTIDPSRAGTSAADEAL